MPKGTVSSTAARRLTCATSSCPVSGSRVVSPCSHKPGATTSRPSQVCRCLSDSLIISYERPAITGTNARRISRSARESGRPRNRKTATLTSITMSRKLVPQRGCRRLYALASSGSSLPVLSYAKIDLCSAPWYSKSLLISFHRLMPYRYARKTPRRSTPSTRLNATPPWTPSQVVTIMGR